MQQQMQGGGNMAQRIQQRMQQQMQQGGEEGEAALKADGAGDAWGDAGDAWGDDSSQGHKRSRH